MVGQAFVHVCAHLTRSSIPQAAAARPNRRSHRRSLAASNPVQQWPRIARVQTMAPLLLTDRPSSSSSLQGVALAVQHPSRIDHIYGNFYGCGNIITSCQGSNAPLFMYIIMSNKNVRTVPAKVLYIISHRGSLSMIYNHIPLVPGIIISGVHIKIHMSLITIRIQFILR